MNNMENSQIELMEAQILGYTHAKQGYSFKSLIESAGLEYEEWLEIKKNGLGLTNQMIEDGDKYFAEENEG